MLQGFGSQKNIFLLKIEQLWQKRLLDFLGIYNFGVFKLIRYCCRYRILVLVTIGQRRQQSVHMFHSFLWDHERDAFASYNYENCHLYANVVVYGIYLD